MAAPHSFKLLFFLFLLSFFHVITVTTTMSCHDHERDALLQFKQSLFASSSSSPYLKIASWKAGGNSSRDCCSWDGVECDDATGYVIGLDLSSSLITATIHSNSTLFSLAHLQNLNLAGNNFMNSSIPPEITRLSGLSFLNLSSSSFSGQIPPELSGMSQLTSLDLSLNYLYGDFPLSIFSLPGLLVLNVTANQNLSGYLPEFNKTSLFRELNIAGTEFSGTIPASIGNLKSLTRLRLRNCYFSGSIPASIGNLTQLTTLSLAANMFTSSNSGDLSWLQKLTKLTVLNLNDTNLYGDVPPSLANLTQLTDLYLSRNHFNKSKNLSWLDKLTKLNLLDLGDSNLYGEIPQSFANLTQLTNLYLERNYFVGQIPHSFSQLKNLKYLYLGENNFTVDADIFLSFRNLAVLTLTGSKITFNYTHHTNFSLPKLEVLDLRFCNLKEFPYFLRYLSNLTELHMYGNNIHGDIPLWLLNMTQLTVLGLDNNGLTGTIPRSFSQLKNLKYLYLGENNFTVDADIFLSFRNLAVLTLTGSKITFNYTHHTNFSLPKLEVLDLRSCNLKEFPYFLQFLSNLRELVLLRNNIHGNIPPWLMNMTQLTFLDLGHNGLTGRIPRSFSQLKKLEFLSLSGNNFTGTIEADIFLSSRKLVYLDLSGCKITLNSPHHSNFSLPKLEVLGLRDCNLTKIPYFLRFASNLRQLALNKNNIHGNIPHWIWHASNNLEILDLCANFLTAFEWNPIAIQSDSLRYIHISNNMLQGNLPVPPPNTYLYTVANNRITGEISPMICGVMSLKVLDLSSNNMSGPIPPCLTDSLEALFLGGNKFSGIIPQTYPKNCDLKVLNLNQNLLTGKVPKSLSNCKLLQILDLSNNQMKQTFPTWLGSLPRLQVLLLHSNLFHGEIGSPRSQSEFPMLCIIDLSHNALTGALPVNYIKIWNEMKVVRTDMNYIGRNVSSVFVVGGFTITYNFSYSSQMVLSNKGVKTEYNMISNIFNAIDLSSNKFTGQVPDSLGSLEALQLLDLSNNHLTGPIPPSLGNLTQLESLDLSQNKLAGVIPEQLAAQLNFLSFFNVSHNLLSGRIPQGPQFNTFDNNSYIGNSGLCGIPLSKNCGTVQPPDDKEDDSEEDKFPSGYDWLFILAGLGSGLVVGFVMGDISMDRHPWLIRGTVQKYGRTQKKPRTRRRQIIRA